MSSKVRVLQACHMCGARCKKDGPVLLLLLASIAAAFAFQRRSWLKTELSRLCWSGQGESIVDVPADISKRYDQQFPLLGKYHRQHDQHSSNTCGANYSTYLTDLDWYHLLADKFVWLPNYSTKGDKPIERRCSWSLASMQGYPGPAQWLRAV